MRRVHLRRKVVQKSQTQSNNLKTLKLLINTQHEYVYLLMKGRKFQKLALLCQAVVAIFSSFQTVVYPVKQTVSLEPVIALPLSL